MATELARLAPDAAGSRRDPTCHLEAPRVYDRSSLPGDFLVMIASQTEADYLRMAPADQRCELIDGIVYMPPYVTAYHQYDLHFLLNLISLYHAHRPVGFLSSGPARLRLAEGRWIEPDLFVIPEVAGVQVLADDHAVPPVLLAVEILSPSNRAYDLEIKATAYREASVDEVWFVDRSNRVVVVDRRAGDGPGYTRESVDAGPIVARSLAGFWFDVGWLWREPHPNLLDCMTTILAGPPGAV